ncbi:NACHT domain-containing protein [Streptomyces spinosisporus]|uniref:NACHT domain-containing protein n=1 Tax=Streptomyces spinosisporus TaxID=2927582 RepID=A0ABS9XWM5_9ACTN|nr:NACHT domain-containing protein [Streptomyces spinosisporus]MCI3245706.1 NACHT domain-containing protein [Streptomyces spinosisporus]
MGGWESAARRVSAVYLVLALGGMIGALWVADRFNLGAAATAVSLMPTLAPLFLSWVTFRSGAERAAEQPLGDIAEHLAQAVQHQWETEVQVRRVNDPHPMTVRWRAAPDDLVESWPLLRATAADWPGELGVHEGWANSPAELEGSGAEITRVFAERVPTRRLLVLGGPGAGKTVLLSRLVLGLLHRRMTSAAGPHSSAVPVLFPLATWNPTRQDLYAWMAERLASDYPTLAEPAPTRYGQIDRARALLGRRLILPVLDGFDEIPTPLRAAALSAINEALPMGHPVVLSSRVGEYRNVLYPHSGVPARLAGAAGIELRPLDAEDVAAYVQRDAGASGYAADRWGPVAAQLGTTTPVGEALRTPLMLFLARAIYNPRPGESSQDLPNPAELCETSRFPTRVAVERHLFSAFITAAYRSHPRYPCRWTPQQAQNTFVFLARYLHRFHNASPDLAWWKLQRGVQRSIPAMVTRAMCLFLTVVSTAVCSIIPPDANDKAFALIVGPILGVFAGIVLALPGWLAFDEEPRRPASGLQWAPNWPASAIVLAAAVLLVASTGLPPVRVATIALGLCIAFGLGVTSADTASAVGPVELWARDRRVFWTLTLGVAASTGLGPWLLLVLSGANAAIQAALLAGALWLGLTIAFTRTVWGPFTASKLHLASRHHIPRNLMAFLADAHQHRGVLRQVGAVYQFRHIDLQRHLARRVDDG